MSELSALKSVIAKLDLQNYPALQEEGEEMAEAFYAYVLYLFETDFNGLINLLYRLDVSEKKFRELMDGFRPCQAYGKEIGGLILEREEERLKWREKFDSK